MKKNSKEFFPLSENIKNEIFETINDVKRIFESDKDTIDYLLLELISSSTKKGVSDKISDWLHINCYNHIVTSDYNKLSNLISLSDLIKNSSSIIESEINENKNTTFSFTYGELNIAINDSIIHEVILASGLPDEKILLLGNIYENYL